MERRGTGSRAGAVVEVGLPGAARRMIDAEACMYPDAVVLVFEQRFEFRQQGTAGESAQSLRRRDADQRALVIERGGKVLDRFRGLLLPSQGGRTKRAPSAKRCPSSCPSTTSQSITERTEQESGALPGADPNERLRAVQGRLGFFAVLRDYRSRPTLCRSPVRPTPVRAARARRGRPSPIAPWQR